MSLNRRLPLPIKALRELGLRQLALYAWYRLALRSGYLHQVTPASKDLRYHSNNEIVEPKAAPQHRISKPASLPGYLSPITNLFQLPDRSALLTLLGQQGLATLLAEADEIVHGQVRLFGGEPVPLLLVTPEPLQHWTTYEKGKTTFFDIKLIWEPARFDWAITLARAYHLSGDERYPESFWRYAETFLQANPPNLGPHWVSAQEVALRLIALVFASQVFLPSPHSTIQRLANLSAAIAGHADRIPPTLAYARSQHNNHLLSEAAGLYTAALALPDHPNAPRWRKLGWRWFNHGLQTQFAPDGSYAQHSTNYHRLVLQIALWVNTLQTGTTGADPFPQKTSERLIAATRWLLALLDPQSGRVPNLGPNDGAYFLRLNSCSFSDYRPTLQAAALAFLGERVFAPGSWDELSFWLSGYQEQGILPKSLVATDGVSKPSNYSRTLNPYKEAPSVLVGRQSWAYLRAARFTSRPGHADQLHLDLWWHGLNIAQDPGTYLYNAQPPWDNSLASTSVHNTLTIDGRDQMTRAGRFLFLDWAQGEIISREQAPDNSWQRLVTRQFGFRRLGIVHQRTVTAHSADVWVVADELLPDANAKLSPATRLHWLLPDWPWEIEEINEARVVLRLKSPFGWIKLSIRVQPKGPSFPPDCHAALATQIVRAGELVYGSGPVSPTWGWVSSTYAQKEPALSFAVEVTLPLPFSLLSEWFFPTS
jgi:hypothetical protein